MNIYLASTSPRRRELLRQLGVRFELLDIEVDETVGEQESASEYVQRVAAQKAIQALSMSDRKNGLILSADTCIALDQAIIGKPKNRQHGLGILESLSGRTHYVYTAVSVCGTEELCNKKASALVVKLQALDSGRIVLTALNKNEVRFRGTTNNERESYWATNEPEGKAGAYAIQGLGAMFIEQIIGSYSGIMGLPLYETEQLLRMFDVSCLQQETE